MSGIFGVITKNGNNCSQDLFYGTDYHTHLGTEYAGIAVLGDKFFRRIHNVSRSQFKSKFYEEYGQIKGNKGVGVISAVEEQPMYLNSKFGPFCIVTNGFIENSLELANNLLAAGISFAEFSPEGVNMTELIAKLINQGKNLIDGIEKMFDQIQGSCSLLILNKDGVYAARDRVGYSPLVLGESNNAIAVTTETCAFVNNDFKVVKDLGPGEIILLAESGIETKLEAKTENQICSFLWIYTGFPASNYEGVNAETVREKSGAHLARRDKGLEVDVVCGVPDSGTAHAIGYANESGFSYRRPLVKYTPGYGRSYTPPSQETRDLIAKMKLISIKEIIENNRIVVCDDSIVRGTQLKNFTVKKLLDSGAKEIHVRAACPPLMFPCIFNISTRSISELAARKAIKKIEGRDIEDVSDYVDSNSDKYKEMVELIGKELQVTSLKYQTVEDMIDAIGLPCDKICLYCWTGKTADKKCDMAQNCSCACDTDQNKF